MNRVAPHAGLTPPARPGTDADLAPLIREINAIGRAVAAQHRVILFNDDVHDFRLVVQVVHLATGASLAKSYAITLEAHEQGQAVAFTGALAECHRVAAIFARVKLQHEID
ncbi:MAG TPA: ATP-dependent Clp protease adaptor ClpS [bacterium]|nr:ATP-dependent Clp protease adaptor ClpS [bacterium]